MTVPTKSPFKAGVFSSVSTVTNASYTITDSDGFDTILVSTGASTRTITLPAVAANSGRSIFIKKIDSGAGIATITPNGGTIDGAASNGLNAQYSFVQIVSDGTNWFVERAWDYMSVTGAASVVTTNVFKEFGNRSLTPGTWNISSGALVESNGTGTSGFQEAISTTSASNAGCTYGVDKLLTSHPTGSTFPVGYSVSYWIAPFTVVLTSTTTYYWNALATYSSGTPSFTFAMFATRMK